MPPPNTRDIENQRSHVTAAEYGRASVAAAEGIDCDLRWRPVYTYAIEESERDALAAEAVAARQRRVTVVMTPTSPTRCTARRAWTSSDRHSCER
jgi:hypothetical protein